jgi:hypothetical protein
MENIKNIYNISGFGDFTHPYEQDCQKMLQQGFEWLETHRKAKLKGHSYQNIYGIFEPDSKDAKELSTATTKDVDCTGAMHQAVMSHLFYIWKNGLEKWKQEV